MKLVATMGDRVETLDITGSAGAYRISLGDQVWEVDARLTAEGLCSLLVGGVAYTAGITLEDAGSIVDVGGETYAVQVEEHTRHVIRTRGGAGAGSGARTVTAPLPGRVTHVAVRTGDAVRPGDTLLVIEAMKMENEFKAAAAGTVAEVRVQAGQAVNAGDVLVVLA